MKTKYKYEFLIGEDQLFLSVGESALINNGKDVIKVKRVRKADNQMWHLIYTINGGVEYSLENGYRTNSGNFRCEFKRKRQYGNHESWYIERYYTKRFWQYSNRENTFYVSEIDGQNTTGREGSYIYMRCPECERIIGTQMNGYSRHLSSH